VQVAAQEHETPDHFAAPLDSRIVVKVNAVKDLHPAAVAYPEVDFGVIVVGQYGREFSQRVD
jgi:hypothetical protein